MSPEPSMLSFLIPKNAQFFKSIFSFLMLDIVVSPLTLKAEQIPESFTPMLFCVYRYLRCI